jgi:hypothetical protein
MKPSFSRLAAFGASVLVGCSSAPKVSSMEYQNCLMTVDLMGDYVDEIEQAAAMTRAQFLSIYTPHRQKGIKQRLLSLPGLLRQNCEGISAEDPVISQKLKDYHERIDRVLTFVQARAKAERARGEVPLDIF